MIVVKLEDWKKCFKGPLWSRIFGALETLTPETPEGETLLQGQDVIVRVISYVSRPPEEAKLEAHRDYIDVQMALAGSERIDWFPLAALRSRTPYDPEKDVEFFERPGRAPARVDVLPGTCCVLFPEDAHMPGLQTGEAPGKVKKVVVKVRAALSGQMG